MMPRLQILFAFLLWSTTGPLVRAADLPVANFITIANAAGLGFLLLIFGRRIVGGLGALPRGPMLRLCLGGIVNIWSSYVAFSYTSVANVILFHYVAPVLVAVAAPMLLRERPEPGTWLALGLAFIGLVVSAWQDVAVGGRRDLVGIALSLVSAFGYALAILESRTVARAGCDPFAVVMIQAGSLSIVTLPLIHWTAWPLEGTLLGALAGVLHLTIAAGFYLVGLRRVPASTGAVLGYSEIVFGLFWGAVLFGEPVTVWKIVGSTAIVGAGLMLVRTTKFSSSPGPENASPAPINPT